jgi:2-polyprenyl-3-methyl-5-hydroxy-6-metoxy-1,4-benzoquinol methylase
MLKRLIENKSILDFGCGTGGFLLFARGVSSRVVGIEIESRLQLRFQKEGLDVFSNIDEVTGDFDIITLFHVLEHVPDPVTLLKQLAEKLNKAGYLIVEVPNANDALLSLYKNKSFSNFTYWSCHLFLFTDATLSMVAKKAGLALNCVKQMQRYPLSNHLYWLLNRKPGGHKVWNFLDSEALRDAYEKQLASLGCCDTIIGSFSKSLKPQIHIRVPEPYGDNYQ